MSSNGFPQKESIAPQVQRPAQCPGCPLGDSLPLVPGEKTCDGHAWWNYDNGAHMNIVYDD